MSQAMNRKFPVEEKIFETAGEKWAARILNDPKPGSLSSPYPDMVLFDLEFKRTDASASAVRRLRLWTSHARLCDDPDYSTMLLDRVSGWLSLSEAVSGEIWFFDG